MCEHPLEVPNAPRGAALSTPLLTHPASVATKQRTEGKPHLTEGVEQFECPVPLLALLTGADRGIEAPNVHTEEVRGHVLRRHRLGAPKFGATSSFVRLPSSASEVLESLRFLGV